MVVRHHITNFRERKSNFIANWRLELPTQKGHLKGMTGTTLEDIPYLDGKLLVAMPGMGDPRFEKAVVFMCAHSPEGAMGLMINKPAYNIGFGELMKQLNISWEKTQSAPKVRLGGPVEHGRGFVLHSAEYHVEDSSMVVNDEFAMTATLDILRDISKEQGPEQAVLTLGYTGWAPGQLEMELQANGWVICEATPHLVYNVPDEEKWSESIKTLGFDPRFLSAEGGSA